jgi:spore germination protein YaaH
MRQRAVHISRAWLLVLAAVFIGLAAIYLNGSGESRTQSDGPAQPSGESPEASRTELDLAAYPAQPPAPRPAECGTATLSAADGAWVVDWLEDDGKRDLLPEQAKTLQLLDFFWMNVGPEPGKLIANADAPQARPLDTVLEVARQANPCGLRFVTVVDNRPLASGETPQDFKRVMARVLLGPAAREQHVKAVAAEMAKHPLADGLTVDYEYGLPQTEADLALYEEVGGLKGMSQTEQVEYISRAYSDLISQLSQVMHHQQRFIRLAVLVRTDDEINPTHIAPYIWDYESLAAVVDQLVFMAYDFHWSTGDPGPIAPAANVRAVWDYVNSYGLPREKLALTVPAYGYDWVVDASGKNSSGTEAEALDATQLSTKNWSKSAEQDGEIRYLYTDPQGRQHEAWETVTKLSEKVAFTRQLCQCSITVWKIGNSDPIGSRVVLDALRSEAR